MILWPEPFDQYGGDEAAMLQGSFCWAQIDAGWTLTNSGARTGTWGLLLPNPNPEVTARRIFGAPKTVVGVGCGVYMSALPVTEFHAGGYAGTDSIRTGLFIHQYRDAANHPQVAFQVGTDGSIVAYNRGYYTGGGDGIATLLGRSDPCLHAASYDHLETLVGCDPTDGFVEVRVNGVTVLNVSGLNTDPWGTGEVSQFATGTSPGLSNISMNTIIDDLFARDDAGSYNNDFIGDKKLYYFPPTVDSTPEDFTPSSGSDSYAMLDEAPPSEADYISTASSAAKTVLGHANLPGDVAAIAAVFAIQRSLKEDAGACDMKPGIRQGATYASGAGQPQTTSIGYYGQGFDVDPVSGVPFTPSDFNSLEQVIERSA